MDHGRLAATRSAIQEVTATEGDATIGVPIAALQKVTRVVYKEVLDARFKHNGVQRTLRAIRDSMPRAIPVQT